MALGKAELLRYEERVRRADPQDPALFTALLNEGMYLLSLLHKDLADDLAMARPTITRWTNGTVVPHPAMRVATYKLLLSRSAALKRRTKVAVAA